MAETSYEKVKRWRRRRKDRLVAAFGGKCGNCGLEDDPVVYDFHHLDPNEKDMNITSKVMRWELVVEEAKKCVMLCAHCHRKYHGGMITIPDTIQRFDETLIPEELLRETVWKKTGRKAKIDWNQYDLVALLEKHGGKISPVANEIGVSWKAVKRQLMKQ